MWDEGNRPADALRDLPRSLYAESIASTEGRCVRLRVARFFGEREDDESDDGETFDAVRAAADARRALDYLRAGHSWLALGFRVGEGWAPVGEEHADAVDLDVWFATELELSVDADDPLARAAVALPGVVGGLVEAPVPVGTGFAVIERIARFSPPGGCGAP